LETSTGRRRKNKKRRSEFQGKKIVHINVRLNPSKITTNRGGKSEDLPGGRRKRKTKVGGHKLFLKKN